MSEARVIDYVPVAKKIAERLKEKARARDEAKVAGRHCVSECRQSDVETLSWVVGELGRAPLWKPANAHPDLLARIEELEGQGGVALIRAERERQVSSEGWTPEHDDSHRQEELARAAACYAMPDAFLRHRKIFGAYCETPVDWPWHDQWWKPTPDDRVKDLTKAGALIAAEIDRLLRARATLSKEVKP